jgi:hypothetical protein
MLIARALPPGSLHEDLDLLIAGVADTEVSMTLTVSLVAFAT